MIEATNAIETVLSDFPDLGPADFACLHDALEDSGREDLAAIVFGSEWTVFHGEMRTKNDILEEAGFILSRLLADPHCRDLWTLGREVRRRLKAGVYSRAISAATDIAGNWGGDGMEDSLLEIVRRLADDNLWVGRAPGFPSDGLELILRESGSARVSPDPLSLAVCCGWSIPVLDGRAVVRWNVMEWSVTDLEVTTPDGTTNVFHDDAESFLQTYGL